MKKEQLPPELVWQEDGHLGEPAVAAVADAEAVVPADAEAHADQCELCTRRGRSGFRPHEEP